MKPIFSLVLFQWRVQKLWRLIRHSLRKISGDIPSAQLVRKFYIFRCVGISFEISSNEDCRNFLRPQADVQIAIDNLAAINAQLVRKFLYLPLHWYFLCDLIWYYPWSLDLIKWTRNKLNNQDNEDSDIQVSFSPFLICCFDDFFAFETYCLLKARWLS